VIWSVATRQEKVPVKLSRLAFHEECFTPLERRLALRTLDGDARNVCDLRDEILLKRSRARGFALKDREVPNTSPTNE